VAVALGSETRVLGHKVGRMSKERARRRAEREAQAARLAAAQAERAAAEARRRARLRRLTGLLPRPTRYARQRGVLARRRRAQNAGILVLFLAVQVAAWFLFPSWTARFAVLALSVLLLPVVITLAFDRRG
jgi:Flp pilus assembly protein TadB